MPRTGRSAAGKQKKKRPQPEWPDGTEKAAGEHQKPRWTFLTNHSHVLILLHKNPDIILREVALAVGVTERAVQRIIQELEADGFVERERIGRRNHYRVLVDQPLRHPIERHRSIGDLLNLVASDTPTAPPAKSD